MNIIKSVSDSQEEIIKNIIELYSPEGIQLDPTYSKGNFYKNIAPPEWKSDLYPSTDGVISADCRDLWFIIDSSIRSVMFDPPFIISGVDKPSSGIIRKRFGDYKTINLLYEMYTEALKEFYRVLSPAGILIFKCQDTVSSGKQYLTHVKVINEAEKIGFYAKDLFVLTAKSRLIDPRIKVQKHARKFHSYFLVFEKR